jgi:hypothetical protein
LLQKGNPWQFPALNDEALAAFKKLLSLLLRPPVIALPREGGVGAEFLLQTDVSQAQVGCVLLLRQTEGEFKPIGFWSRKLEKAELIYSAMSVKRWLSLGRSIS